MAKKLEYQIGVDATQGISGVKNFSKAVSSELKKVEGDFDDTATAGEKVATVLSAMARDLDSELGRASTAADALRQALGEDLAGRADIGSIVGDLQRMGLTFEDITTDADKLAAALKQMDEVQLKGVNSGLAGVKTNVGEVGKSADSSRSALANMVGNATQDLGALGGLAGSAGVAIGQMGEYMADAAFEGEGLTTVVKNFTAVAGPIAAIAVATQLLSSYLAGIKAQEAFNEEQVDKFAGAMRDASTVAQTLHDQLIQTGELPFLKRQDPSWLTPWKGLSQETENLLPVLDRLGIGFDKFMQIVQDPKGMKAIAAQIAALEKQGKLTPQIVQDVKDLGLAVGQTASEQEAATRINEELNRVLSITPQMASDATEAFLRMQDPIKTFPAEFARIGEALSKGVTPSARDLETVTEGLGIKIEDALSIGQQAYQDITDAAAAYKDKVGEIAGQLDDINTNMEDWRTSAQEVGIAMGEAMVPFEDGSAAADAFRTALDKVGRTKGLDTLQQLGDTKEAMQQVFTDIRKNDRTIPDIFDRASDSARQFNDHLAALSDTYKDQLQQVVQDSAGDFDKVRDRVDKLRNQLARRAAITLGIDLEAATPDERKKIDALVNAVIPTDKEIELGIKLAHKDLVKLKADLAIEQLQTLLPATALQLKVDLAEGEITPRVAAATAQQILDENGVTVDLDVNMHRADQTLVEFAQVERTTTMGVVIPDSALQTAAGAIDAGPGGRGWPPIEVPVKPVFDANAFFAGLGLGVGVSGTAATARGVGITAAPAATVTTAPLKVPVSGRAAGQTVVIYNTLQAGTIGAPFDVMYAMDQSSRRFARLMPKVP